MSRRPARFTQADVNRAIRAAERAGISMAVEILPNGIIRLSPVAPGCLTQGQDDAELDRELAGHLSKYANGHA
jgi:hypothetical protein